MASSGAEIVKFIKLQEDTMKLQQQLYISFLPYTSADDKIKILSTCACLTGNDVSHVTGRGPVRKYVLRMRNRKLRIIHPSGPFSPEVTSVT
jgi:hypothetical protein